MKSSPEQLFRCLTLYKQDIIELANLFHYYFQRVEIFIDDIPILNLVQLDPCDPEYEAKSLVLRGYHLELTGKGELRHYQLRPVEVKADKSFVTLIGWKANDKQAPEAAVQLKNFFAHRQNDTQKFLLITATCGTYWGGSMMLKSESQNSFPPVSLIITPFTWIAFAIYGFAALVLLLAVLKRFQLDTYVFLLPGAIQTERKYGRREVRGTLVVSVVLYIVLHVLMKLVIGILKNALSIH